MRCVAQPGAQRGGKRHAETVRHLSPLRRASVVRAVSSSTCIDEGIESDMSESRPRYESLDDELECSGCVVEWVLADEGLC